MAVQYVQPLQRKTKWEKCCVYNPCFMFSYVFSLGNLPRQLLFTTFATRALEDSVNVKALSKIPGHTDVDFTTQRYCLPNVNFLREEMEMIDQVRKSRNN